MQYTIPSAYDELINLMLEEGTLDQSVRLDIQNMSGVEKRLHIATLLDNGLGLFSRIGEIMHLSKPEYIKEVIKLLKEYVLKAEVEKKKFGEVMTPLTLVKEMLQTLPEETWSNPDLKINDPANGTGPYPIMVIYKLMKGLETWEPDAEKRYKHIVENMIYVCELQPKNMFLYMCAVDPFDTYKLNIYTGSFLEGEFDKHMKDVWGVDKFQISLGNPPYNQMIDMLFVQQAYKFSDKILYVHPSTWLLDEKGKQKKFNETKDLINKDLESIYLFNGNQIFNITIAIPCCFTYINKKKQDPRIKSVDVINSRTIYYDDIYQINKYSDLETYVKLKEKIIKISKIDNIRNHVFKSGNYYVNISQIGGNVYKNSKNKMVKDDFYTLVIKDSEISTHPKMQYVGFSEKKHAETFLNYVKSKFARFCLSIYKTNKNLHRGELEIVPWIDFSVDWNEDRIIEDLEITQKELDFINSVIPNYYF